MTEERIVSTSLGQPTPIQLPQPPQPSPLSLDMLDKWHVQKSFHLYSKLENFLPHVSHRLPISISKGFNMNLLCIRDSLSSRVWCNTFISSHMSNIKRKKMGLQNLNFENIHYGGIFFNFHILLCFSLEFFLPPSFLHFLALLLLKTCPFWYQGRSKVWLFLNFLLQYL